jgi:hypothetical protein
MIAIHTIKNIIHNIFLKIEFGELAHFILFINFCHNRAIKSNTTPNQRA